MCDPMAIVSGLSSVVGYMGQIQATNQQAEYQSQLALARNQEIISNYDAANAAAIDSYKQSNQKLVEQQQSYSAEMQDLNVEKMNSVGQVLASNLNTGASLDAIRLDYERQADRYQGVQEQSLKNMGIQTEAEKHEAYKTAEARSNSISSYIPSPVNYPSPLTLAVGLGGAYTGYLDRKTATPYSGK